MENNELKITRTKTEFSEFRFKNKVRGSDNDHDVKIQRSTEYRGLAEDVVGKIKRG